MTGVYQKHGIRFLYPENWTAEENPEDDGLVCAVNLESPEGAIWTVNIEPGQRDCEELAASVLRVLREEYDELEVEQYSGFVGQEIPVVGYEVHFCCLDLIVKALIRSFHWEDRTVLLMTQAEVRDHDRLTPVFDAIVVSLLQPA